MAPRIIMSGLAIALLASAMCAQKTKPQPKQDRATETVSNVISKIENNQSKAISGFSTTDVLILYANPDIRTVGLSEEQLETYSEGKLAAAGFKIEQFTTPEFEIHIDATKGEGTEIIYSVNVML